MDQDPAATRYPWFGDDLPRPEREEERGIADRARAHDPEAIARLVAAHFALVVHIAREFRGRGVPAEDLISEGCVGLLKAMQRFDTAAGTRFTTYASFWVRREMLLALMTQPRVVHIPRYARQRGEPTPLEIRIDAPVAGTDGPNLADRLADHAAQPATDGIIARQELESLRRHVLELAPRERTVLVERFGLQGEGARTLEEIGLQMGISRERVRQIEVSALARLRREFRR